MLLKPLMVQMLFLISFSSFRIKCVNCSGIWRYIHKVFCFGFTSSKFCKKKIVFKFVHLATHVDITGCVFTHTHTTHNWRCSADFLWRMSVDWAHTYGWPEPDAQSSMSTEMVGRRGGGGGISANNQGQIVLQAFPHLSLGLLKIFYLTIFWNFIQCIVQ